MTASPTTRAGTQVSRAIEALLEGWCSPKQLTAKAGRANPNGLIRDTRPEAARRGLLWEEVWVKDAVTRRRYKMHHLARTGAVIAKRAERVRDGPVSAERLLVSHSGDSQPPASAESQPVPIFHDGLRLGNSGRLPL